MCQVQFGQLEWAYRTRRRRRKLTIVRASLLLPFPHHCCFCCYCRPCLFKSKHKTPLCVCVCVWVSQVKRIRAKQSYLGGKIRRLSNRKWRDKRDKRDLLRLPSYRKIVNVKNCHTTVSQVLVEAQRILTQWARRKECSTCQVTDTIYLLVT